MPDDKKKKPLTETHAQAAENLSERLCTAALNGDLASVKALLATDANVNASDNSGQTPLHYAVKCNDDPEPVINALIAAGADIEALDKHGYTPLQSTGFSIRAATALIKAGAKVTPELQHELDFWKRMVDSSEQLDPPLP